MEKEIIEVGEEDISSSNAESTSKSPSNSKYLVEASCLKE